MTLSRGIVMESMGVIVFSTNAVECGEYLQAVIDILVVNSDRK